MNPTSNSWDLAVEAQPQERLRVPVRHRARGVEVLRLKGGAHASAGMKTVTTPRAPSNRGAAVVIGALDTTASGGLVCPLFSIPG